jgi:hypothetical protein
LTACFIKRSSKRAAKEPGGERGRPLYEKKLFCPFLPNTTMIPSETNGLAAQALKQKFLQWFEVRTTSATALQEVVKGLIDQGFSRKTLVAWAVQEGYPKKYVSSVLSRIFCALGLRERQPGAGRKPSPEVLELLAHAQARYGARSLKVLRAAWRTGKTQSAARLEEVAPSAGIVAEPQLAPPLRSPGAYYGSILSGMEKPLPGTVSASISPQESVVCSPKAFL